MKKQLMKGIIAFIVILFTNLAVFLLMEDFNEAFWICYLFSMIAVLTASAMEIFYGNKEILIFKYPVMLVTYLYMVIALVVALITYNVLQEHILILFLINLYVFASYLIGLLSTFIHNNTTKEQQAVRAKDIVNFRYILDRMKSVISKVQYADKNYKMLQHAYDSLASGQTKSNDAASAIEKQILEFIDLLDNAIVDENQENVVSLCQKIEKAADERKRVLNSSKLF